MVHHLLILHKVKWKNYLERGIKNGISESDRDLLKNHPKYMLNLLHPECSRDRKILIRVAETYRRRFQPEPSVVRSVSSKKTPRF